MRNVCGVCQRQPCVCALARNPVWIAQLLIDAGVLELDPCIPPAHRAEIAYQVGAASVGWMQRLAAVRYVRPD